MKTAASAASCWAFMLGCLALLLVAGPAGAEGVDFGGLVTAAPTAAGEVGTPPAPVLDEDSDEPVVIDILVTGKTTEQTQAITDFITFLKAGNISYNNSKVNASVVWDHRNHAHEDKDRRRALRASRSNNRMLKKGLKDGEIEVVEEDEDMTVNNSTSCQLIYNGGNYSVVHVTLNNKASKRLVNLVIKMLTKPDFLPQAIANHLPFTEFICKTNVRMQSEAPPANFAPMSESEPEGLSAGQKAGVAIGVIGGAAVVGAIGFFAFKSFGAAAATV